MKHFVSILLIALLVVIASGCGHKVEVPPAHVGKLSTKSGLQETIIQQSKLRLRWPCRTCDSLILAEASDHGFTESLTIFMPKDQLNLKVDVRGILAISSDQANVNKIFARVPASNTQDKYIKIIGLDKVYIPYGQPVLRELVRTVMTKYSIAEVMENRGAISTELHQTGMAKLKESPMTLLQFALANIQPPKVIVNAQIQRKAREVAIGKAEADKLVSLKQAEAALEVAKMQQQVDLTEAETQLMVNRKLAEGVSQAYIAQRSLKILETLANSNNKVILLPMEALRNPALLTGLTNDAMKDLKPEKAIVTSKVE